MKSFNIPISIFNYLIPIYLSIYPYENLLHYTFNVSLPLSITKPVIFLYCILLQYIISKNNILLKINFKEFNFLLAIILLFVFSYINIGLGITYSFSMFFLFYSIYLLKHIKQYLNFAIIIKWTIYLNFPLIIINTILTFFPYYYTYKYQFFGTHDNPNVLGMWLLFILALIYLYDENKRFRNLIFFMTIYLIISTISRSTIISSLFIILLYFWNNKKVLYIILFTVTIIFIYYQNDIYLISSIIKRFSGDSARDVHSMFFLISHNNFMPNGTNTFSFLMHTMGSIPDNSYLAMISDLGFLSIFYFLPFFYFFIFTNFQAKLFIFSLLFQSIFEKVLMSPVNSYLILILIMMIVFPEQFYFIKYRRS